MQLLGLPNQVLSRYSSLMLYSGTSDFLLSTIFSSGLSASLHFVLVLGFLVSWVANRLRARNGHDSKSGYSGTKFLYLKMAFLCAAGESMLNLVICMWSYFSRYGIDLSDEKFVVLSDFAVKSIAWGVICVYLHAQSSSSSESKFPFLLRVWWGFFLSVSSYCLIVDILLGKKQIFLPICHFVSDAVSVLTGLFFCSVGFLVKLEGRESRDRDARLDEPLLSDDSRAAGLSKSKGDETVTAYSKASIFGLLTFSWISPLIALGNKKTLQLEDVPQLDFRDTLVGACSNFKTTSRMTNFMLVTALVSSSWKDILFTALLAILNTLASYVGPYLIDTFIKYLTGRYHFRNEGHALVAAFLVAKLVECISERQLVFRLKQVGIRTRARLISMIYEKALTLSCHSRQAHTSGEVTNIVSVDVGRVGGFIWGMHDPWLVLLQVGLAMAILYKNLGWVAALAAFMAAVLLMLVNIPLASLQEKFQNGWMKSKDKRMKATSEVLSNMRILKLQAWEMKFLSRILTLRKLETQWLKKCIFTNLIVTFVFWGASAFISVVTFGACILIGIPLDTGKILSSLATFRILQEPIFNLPGTISGIVQTKVSLDRIASFLGLDNLQDDVVETLPGGTTDIAIELIDANFAWNSSSSDSDLTLRNINLKIQHGMHVAICGTVGSGKSTLLSCILGEVPKISGTVRLCGTKAYVAQSPWIQSGKIQDNILFGKEMDRERYERILKACALNKDLEILPFGDQTLIGERGINLSGGQKQRVQIARALYQDADIFLFDDPFSAVDAHTGSHLFKECLLGLLSNKTVVYVTHQVEFLSSADLILVMKDGRITEAGKYNDILRAERDFMELVSAHKIALVDLHLESGDIAENDHVESVKTGSENGDEKSVQNVEKGQLVQEEKREKGSVGFPVYWKYITMAYGGALVPFVLLAQILFQLLQVGSNYWMAWAVPASPDSNPTISGLKLMLVYVALAVGSSLCGLGRGTLVATAGYTTGNILFNKMHHCIFRAPMSFFDATPSGRILSRASGDQGKVDMSLASTIAWFAFSLIRLMAVIAVMSQVALPISLIFVPLVSACVWYQRYYIPSARELSRLFGVSRAPVIQHFSETLSGLTTIRSFDQGSRFQATNAKLFYAFSRPLFHNAGAMEWLCFRVDLLSAITFGFSLVFLVSLPEGLIDPAIAGLAVTYGLTLDTMQAGIVFSLCSMEKSIIAVERILQYTSIPSELPLMIEENRPGPSWPSNGEISIHNLQVRYAPQLPLVLRGITCTFRGGVKTGIVGRTGSGKSTLIQVLFRIMDPASGCIELDGINISSVGVHDLRSRLSIIAQDPTMFEGTIRSNLDPLEEYTDEQIWEALDKCQLGDEVRKKELKLYSTVTENGENWSMGQRQLVCLGRVLLKKNKVLVLDEATASVDTATDNLIQPTLREHFSDCTVVAIAHRITSILDSDMVLLLDHGLVGEFGSPKNLLEDRSSSFSKLVVEYTSRSNSEFES